MCTLRKSDCHTDFPKGPSFEPSWPSTLAHRIDDVARNNPGVVALNDTRGNTVSYEDLIERSSQIARALLNANVKPNAAVVVYQEPSFDWICSLLAVIRVGAIYVPFDINIPPARLEIMLESCQPFMILAHGATVEDAEKLNAKQTVLIKDVSTVSSTLTSITPVTARANAPIAILSQSSRSSDSDLQLWR